jgi:RNA polymerase sigma-70 factor (ECF subfamily)
MIEGEKQLIEAARHGDAEAFGVLYKHYLNQIYRFIMLKTGSKSETEDLTHEVFLSAWRNMPTYKEQGNPLSSWLYQIARNKIIDYFRTKKIDITLDEVAETHAEEGASADLAVEHLINSQKIQTAISRLPEEQQTLLILRYVEDLSPKDIAEIVGKSEGAVRVMQHRAILRLRHELKNINEDNLA